MRFKQAEIGDYRVYAGAVEAPQGGYTAGVAVEQVRGIFGGPRRVLFDGLLNGGHRFDDAASALQKALAVGRKAVYAQLSRTRREVLVHS